MIFDTSESLAKLYQKFFSIIFIICLLASCSNPLNKSDNSDNFIENKKIETKYTTINGTLDITSVYPNSYRTAFPSLPASITYSIKAVGTDTVNPAADVEATIINANTEPITFLLNIPTPETTKKYKIKASVISDGKEILTGESDEFSLNPENSVISKDIEISVTQASGKTGNIALEIGIEDGSGITKCRIDIDDTQNAATPYVNSNKITFTKNGLASGVHTVVFKFTDNASKVLYSFTETINVFDNLTTNTWVQNGNEPWFTTTGTGSSKVTTCRITKEMVERYALTQFWVDPTAANDNGSGSFFQPKKTLTGALSLLHDAGKDYTIYIKGTLDGQTHGVLSITDELSSTAGDTKAYHAHSLTICGATGLNGSGIPQDVINAKGVDIALSITTQVPVTIKNLKIMRGYSEDSGGGIYSTGDLTLDSGTLITQNTAKYYGGGVANDGGKLTIKSGVVISSNEVLYAKKGTDDCGGGGVYNRNGTLIMSGGTIKSNTAEGCGGGIFNIIDDGEKLCVAYIYGDAVIGGDTAADGNKSLTTVNGIGGGGIYNKAGLIYFGCAGYLATGNQMEDVTYYDPDPAKIIPWTGKLSHNTTGGWGGGIINYPSSLAPNTYGHKVTGIIHVQSGKISSNFATMGGGIAHHNGTLFYIHGGTIGGDSASEGNSATNKGGGIYTMGKFYLKGGTVSYNTADLGGGVCGDNGLLMYGGTIKNNTATTHGGGVFVDYRSLQIRESAYIPAGSDGKNDVYLNKRDTEADPAVVYLVDPLTPPEECTDGIIASITPSAYTEDTPIFTISAPATAAEISHFKVTPNGTQDWGITTAGKLREGVALPSSYSSMESGKTYFVSDSSGIGKIAEFSSSGYNFSGVKLKIESNVTIDTAWTPIGNSTAFSGTFDGNGKTVTFAVGSNAEAVFGTVNGTVKNLKVAGSTSVAGIAKIANTSAVIENCENSATVTSTEQYCAGIVAEVNNATIKGCVNKGTVISNYEATSNVGISLKGAGGITGPVKNGGVVDSCVNEGNVTGLGAGGITSFIDSRCTIRNSQNSGDITSTERHAGGIAGVAAGDGADIEQASHIDNCFNSGSVTASGMGVSVYAGGIVGQLGGGNAAWAKNCLNIGNVSLSPSAASGSHAGALFGRKDNYARIDFCYYKEGCAGTAKGVGGSSLDTRNQCIKATQTGLNDAVNYVELTLNETTYSADSSTVLSLLNAWVSANSTNGLYLVWESGTNHWPKLKTE